MFMLTKVEEGNMSAATLTKDNKNRQSFIQQMNEKWQRKYEQEQAWLDTMDRLTIERTR